MRNVILYFHMTLDNVVSNPEKWMLMNDDILKSALDYYDTLDTVIFGSRTYPFLAQYWTNAEHNSPSKTEKEFAKKINRIKKLILSRSTVNLVWDNSVLLNFTGIETFSKLIGSMKQRDGKNISVESGIGVWKLFLENSLFDELLVSVHPVIARQGDKIFDDVQPKYELDLKNIKAFDNGVVELQYAKSGSLGLMT